MDFQPNHKNSFGYEKSFLRPGRNFDNKIHFEEPTH